MKKPTVNTIESVGYLLNEVLSMTLVDFTEIAIKRDTLKESTNQEEIDEIADWCDMILEQCSDDASKLDYAYQMSMRQPEEEESLPF